MVECSYTLCSTFRCMMTLHNWSAHATHFSYLSSYHRVNSQTCVGAGQVFSTKSVQISRPIWTQINLFHQCATNMSPIITTSITYHLKSNTSHLIDGVYKLTIVLIGNVFCFVCFVWIEYMWGLNTHCSNKLQDYGWFIVDAYTFINILKCIVDTQPIKAESTYWESIESILRL